MGLSISSGGDKAYVEFKDGGYHREHDLEGRGGVERGRQGEETTELEGDSQEGATVGRGVIMERVWWERIGHVIFWSEKMRMDF